MSKNILAVTLTQTSRAHNYGMDLLITELKMMP